MIQSENAKKERAQKMKDAEEYAKLLSASKRDVTLYKLLSVAMESHTEGIKTALRCWNVAQTA